MRLMDERSAGPACSSQDDDDHPAIVEYDFTAPVVATVRSVRRRRWIIASVIGIIAVVICATALIARLRRTSDDEPASQMPDLSQGELSPPFGTSAPTIPATTPPTPTSTPPPAPAPTSRPDVRSSTTRPAVAGPAPMEPSEPPSTKRTPAPSAQRTTPPQPTGQRPTSSQTPAGPGQAKIVNKLKVPADGAMVPASSVDARGTIDITDGYREAWLLVESPDAQSFYPGIAPLPVDGDGNWTQSIYIGGADAPPNTRYLVHVVLVTPQGAAALAAYRAKEAATSKIAGLTAAQVADLGAIVITNEVKRA